MAKSRGDQMRPGRDEGGPLPDGAAPRGRGGRGNRGGNDQDDG